MLIFRSSRRFIFLALLLVAPLVCYSQWDDQAFGARSGKSTGALVDLSIRREGPQHRVRFDAPAVFIATHAEPRWQGAHKITEPLHDLGRLWSEAGLPSLFLSSNRDQYQGLVAEDLWSFVAYSGGEISIDPDSTVQEVWLAGGYFTLCLGSTLVSLLEWLERSDKNVNVVYVTTAVFEEYSPFFWYDELPWDGDSPMGNRYGEDWYQPLSYFLSEVRLSKARLEILAKKLRPWVNHNSECAQVTLHYFDSDLDGGSQTQVLQKKDNCHIQAQMNIYIYHDDSWRHRLRQLSAGAEQKVINNSQPITIN